MSSKTTSIMMVQLLSLGRGRCGSAIDSDMGPSPRDRVVVSFGIENRN